MKKVMTPEIEKFIIEHSQLFSARKIAELSSVSRDTVRRVLQRNNIEVSNQLRAKWKSESARNKTTFTPEEDEIIISNYLTTPVKAIGKIINRSFCGITTRMKQLGLTIPEELKAERKTIGMFKEGNIPPLKGKKMTEEQYKKYKHTFFKKGNVPHNAKKDGEEVKRKDRNGSVYILIKVPEKKRLVYKHVWMWEQENGKVPDNHAVVFKDGNSLNFVDNLECISKTELLSRNTIYRYPEDLQKAMRLQGLIKKKVRNLKKQQL